MNEYLLQIAVFEAAGSVGPKFQVEGDVPPPTILRVRKLDEFAFHMVRMSAEL